MILRKTFSTTVQFVCKIFGNYSKVWLKDIMIVSISSVLDIVFQFKETLYLFAPKKLKKILLKIIIEEFSFKLQQTKLKSTP